jgi:hypothetical protein
MNVRSVWPKLWQKNPPSGEVREMWALMIARKIFHAGNKEPKYLIYVFETREAAEEYAGEKDKGSIRKLGVVYE